MSSSNPFPAFAPTTTNASASASGSATPRQQPRARRRTTTILLIVALMAVAGLAAAFSVNQIKTQNRVVQVRADISRGAIIKPTDLGEITVGSVQGVSTTPADQISSLVGRQASVDLVMGSLLPENAIGDIAVPGPDRTLVGLRLEQGRMVAGDVRPGSRVRLVVTVPQGGDPTFTDASSSKVFTATLSSSEPALDGAATLVNVEVSSADAVRVAQLAAVSRIAVVQDPQG